MSTPGWRLTWPAEIVFGRGSSAELPALLPPGDRVLVVVSRSTAHLATVLLGEDRVEVARVEVTGEPVLEVVAAEVVRVRPTAPELIVAVGGGSVIDTAKALAAFLPNDRHAPRDHLEVVGAGHPLDRDPLPVVALPTTAGTGAEATHNAVLAVPDAARKVSLRDRRLTPRLVVVDPDLGREVPHAVAVAAGLDAAVQLVEAAVTPLASPPARMAAVEGAALALPALAALVAGSATRQDRDALAYGALLSGIALANGKLGTIHGFAGVLGGHRDLAHGVLCGWFAAPVLTATIAALRERTDADAALALARYAELAAVAVAVPTAPAGGADAALPTPAGRPPAGAAAAEDLAVWFEDVVTAAGLPPLDLTGLSVEEVVTAVGQASSTRGNPVALDDVRLRRVLDAIPG